MGLRGVTATPASEKMPLESRVWYNYQGQANPDYIDPTATTLPNMTARLLDDSSTTKLYRENLQRDRRLCHAKHRSGRPRDRSAVYAANAQDLIQTHSPEKRREQRAAFRHATYNAIHLPLTATDASGQITTNTYNAFGQPVTITNPKGEVTTMVYDGNGYLQTTTGAIPGSTTTYTYDSAGRVQTVKDSEGYIVTSAYDNLNRLTKQMFPDSTFRQTVYDRLSVGSTADRLGRMTSYTYDGLGRVIQIKDPLNRIVNQTWCKCGALQTLQDKATATHHDVEVRYSGPFDLEDLRRWQGRPFCVRKQYQPVD